MSRKHHKPEEIVAKLRRVDVLVSQGQSTRAGYLCKSLRNCPAIAVKRLKGIYRRENSGFPGPAS